MKFKYKIDNLKLFGYHGVFNDEKNNGQYFYINISYECNYPEEINDDLSTVLDYSRICKDVEKIFNLKKYNLLEILVIDIKNYLSIKYKNVNFKVKVFKSDKYMNSNLDNISVEI